MYVYVNSFTVPDAYPMCTVDKITQKVGHGRHISVFDTKSRYWQVKVEPKDMWLTVFVTHVGLYK